jgi:hypothetical protein
MEARFSETQSYQRAGLFELLEDLNVRIKEVERWLEEKGAGDAKVQLLLYAQRYRVTNRFAVVHTLGDINRFPSSKEAVASDGT